MKAERQNQKQLEELFGSKGSSKVSEDKGRCFKCNQTGHRQSECPIKSSGGPKRNHGTQQKPPKRCPACGNQHTATNVDGKVYYKNRLSVCDKFCDKSLEEKAGLVQLAGGCSLCLDWIGEHKAKDCQAKGRNGRKLEACNQMVGGQPCGRPHDRLLHGTGNKYCNSVRKVSNSNH